MAKTKEAVLEAERPEVDTPVVEIVETPVAAAAEKIDGIDELKRQLEAEKTARAGEREARERAERERNAATQQVFHAKNAQDDAESRLFDGAVAQLKSNTHILKQQLKEAWATNDFDRAADIQEAIADNSAKINSIEAGKQAIKERPKEQPRALDPVEAFASQLSPRSAAWVRAHPEYATNERLKQKMINAHQMALLDGIQADTNDYFEAVEDALKISMPRGKVFVAEPDRDYEPSLSAASAPTQRRQSPAAAPVSRDVTPSGERKRTIRLTAAEAEIARLTGQTEQEYYANKMRGLN